MSPPQRPSYPVGLASLVLGFNDPNLFLLFPVLRGNHYLCYFLFCVFEILCAKITNMICFHEQTLILKTKQSFFLMKIIDVPIFSVNVLITLIQQETKNNKPQEFSIPLKVR